MQQQAGQLENNLTIYTETEGEREKIVNEDKEVRKAKEEEEEEEAKCNGKVADVFSELNSAMESLSKANQELEIKEMAIKALKKELDKAEEKEAQFPEQLKDELARSKERIRHLEIEIEKRKESESKMLDSLAIQTKLLEQTKMLLEESNIQADNHIEKASFQKPDNSGDKPEQVLNAEEIELLKIELKQAIKAEQNSKKAMDDLALALTEVAAEANQTKEKLILTEDELQHFRKESEALKEKVRAMEEQHTILLDEAKKEADLHRNTSDRLRFEAEETLQAWNGKEKGFVDCIKRAEDEKIAAIEENNKLLEALSVAENMNKSAKQENQKLRDILKQALNEANAAKEAAGIARSENSQLKDLLAEKDDAMIFITRENENLRINEVAAMENIKELNRLLSEASAGYKPEEKEQENKLKSQNSAEKEQRERKLSTAFSLNLKDLITYAKHKDIHEDHKIQEKHVENEEDEDEETADPLKGSIFDVTNSPVAAATPHNHQHHHHQRRASFAEEGDTSSPEELEHLDGAHIDDVENERNSKKKKALLRRFGDIITRRRGSFHRRELSNGGEGQKKEPSSAGSEAHRKEPSSAGSEGHNKKDAFSDSATPRKENSIGD